ncbi:toll/interleukin-1 receptor domain-containing protein [Aurantiacibacter poecillastricola]|uniref:toll/interleukin-1 receptor domain-containing protein n=1 Tax=Aurantiacibacter poecillastricola TaxID=3064385 RepID=UPI00273E3D21|nr:toll/interleukin-1 receptor domain-containing protein [Aurantiacibacter sp. 219JJ12-13]MDP5262409.1 toll/interleukin-1 receptor domain-containing protein [Aurantiacibacter sp. 219JJ12-13]
MSYSHRDKRWADWLHRALETYRPPRHLLGRLSETASSQGRLRPIFRDRDELAASADLGERIERALSEAAALIVLCSPAAARSRWTNQEIATFKRIHPDRPILAAIIAGEPYASNMEGRGNEECFPEALRFELDSDGTLSDRRAEPIAADFREQGDGRRLGKLKLIAGLLNVGLDDLVQRDNARRTRRLALVAAASAIGMVGTSALALYAFDQRNEAREQRAEADGLIEYMLTDLRSELEPVGRLDVLDGVGHRAMQYYAKQSLADLTDTELGRRARATQLVAEVQNLRGDNEAAFPAFQQSARTTAAILERRPNDPEALFNHSQSEFWVGYLAWQTGRMDAAQRHFSNYRDLAEKLVAMEPANDEFRAELGHANTNLGVLSLERGENPEATEFFRQAELVWRRLGGDAPDGPPELAHSLAQAIAWQSDARRKEGELAAALDLREAERRIYERLLARSDDSGARESLLVNSLSLARMEFDLGNIARGREAAREAYRLGDDLRRRDPTNALWKAFSARAGIVMAEGHLLANNPADAATANSAALQTCRELVRGDPGVREWRDDCLAMALAQQALIDLSRGDRAQAQLFAEQFRRDFTPLAESANSSVLVAAGLVSMVDGRAPLDWHAIGSYPDARLSAMADREGASFSKTGAYPIAQLLRF